MGLLSKLFGKRDASIHDFVLRLAVRGPTGQTRHQFIEFQARSVVTALQHAQRRADQENVLRWKLFDDRKREVAAGFARRRAPKTETHEVPQVEAT